MKLAIMQPYFFPYIGYFQLLSAVDEFVVYDNVKYTKKGWINRNRILNISKDQLFTIPLKKASDYLDIRDRELPDDSLVESHKILRKIKIAYSGSPFYDEVYPLLESCFLYNNKNLFHYLYNSIIQICSFLEIPTKVVISSQIESDSVLKGEQRVLSICKDRNATHYINAIGGVELYKKEVFQNEHLHLSFLKTNKLEYQQGNSTFVPNLSIIDVLMYNGKEGTKKLLNQYELV